MNIVCGESEEYSKLYKIIVARENFEDKALSILTSEILQKLNTNVEKLPKKCQSMLGQVAKIQLALRIQHLDPVCISLYRSRELSEKLQDEYEILQLKQKNAKLQAKIDCNNRFLANLRKDLQYSKHSLASQNLNPDNIQDYIKQLKQKLATYEKSYEGIKNKYSSLNVPETILPKALESQVQSLLALREEAIGLKMRADDVSIFRETKQQLYSLRK